MSLLRQTPSRCFAQLPRHPLTHTGAASPLRRLSAPLQTQLQPRRRLHIGDAITNTTSVVAEAVSSIHHAGVPWYLTIPMVAVGISLGVRLPLTYYTRLRIEKMKELSPLLSPWAFRARLKTSSPTQARLLFLRSSTRIYKAFGVQRWKGWVAWLAPMVPFITVSVAIRRLTGASTVALGETASSVAGKVDAVFDPSLAQGGMLWFTDLTAADPYYVLPALSSAAIAANLWLNMPRDRLRALIMLDSRPGAPVSDSPLFRGVARLSLLMPLFPLVMSHLPSAIMLYWSTNFMFTFVNELIVRRLVPKKPARVEIEKASDDYTNKVRPWLPAEYPPEADGSEKVNENSAVTEKSKS